MIALAQWLQVIVTPGIFLVAVPGMKKLRANCSRCRGLTWFWLARLRKSSRHEQTSQQQEQHRRAANAFEFGYGHVVGVVVELRASGAVEGLLKSTELLFVSVQLALRITDRAFELVPETAIGKVSEQFAVVP